MLAAASAEGKERVFVLTDISNEPDDEESLVRFLVYANEYDIEGLVATTSTWLRQNTREDLIRRQIAGSSVQELAAEFGTPVYIYDAESIVQRLASTTVSAA